MGAGSKLRSIGLAVVLVGLASGADAALVSCPGTAATDDREFKLDTSIAATCFAFGSGNINGEINIKHPENGDQFLPGHPGYVVIDISNNTNTYVGVDGELNIGSGSSGSFSFTKPLGYHNFVLAFKTGANLDPVWAAFLLPDSVSGGTWSIIPGQDLSHANLYAIAGVAQTPVPGALWLMGTVLAGWFGGSRLRLRARA
jgi:hypothetical protein